MLAAVHTLLFQDGLGAHTSLSQQQHNGCRVCLAGAQAFARPTQAARVPATHANAQESPQVRAHSLLSGSGKLSVDLAALRTKDVRRLAKRIERVQLGTTKAAGSRP